MIKQFTTLTFGLIFGLVSASIGMAQEPSININPLTIEGGFVGNRYVIDADFAAEFDIPVPAPFEFFAPTSGNYQIFSEAAPGGTGMFKISFVTSDRQVMSNLQFVPFTLPRGDAQAELDGLKRLLEQAFAGSVPNLERAELTVVQITEIGDITALEAIGRYDGGVDGIVILRIVAISNPDNENGVIAIINALTKNNDMASVADVLTIEASTALSTFRFQ
ncbi:MAG: hypothetical protein JKY31_03815 [Rhodobacteraceae bacterium]|nr:hypothetical protein [Paracoccaceae bacterium]